MDNGTDSKSGQIKTGYLDGMVPPHVGSETIRTTEGWNESEVNGELRLGI